MYQCKEEFGGVADFSSFRVHRTVRMVVMVVFLFQKVIIIIHSIFLASTSPCLASKLLRSSSTAAQSWKENSTRIERQDGRYGHRGIHL